MARINRIKGQAAVRRQLNAHREKLEKGVELGILSAGVFLLGKSMEVVPVDTAALINSGRVRREEGTKGFNTVVYVGYRTNYAVYVHEDLNANHAPGKTAKFLETPIRENLDGIAGAVRDEIENQLK